MNLTEKLVQAVMNAIETADMDTYINSTRQERIKAAIRSVLGQEWVTDERIVQEFEKYKDWVAATGDTLGSLELFSIGAKWMREQITTPPTT